MDQLRDRTAIIVPVYNEEHTLAKVLDELVATNLRIYCVNDCSTDQTQNILLNYSEKIYCIEHLKNLGQGGALKTGIEIAKQNTKNDFFITFDADGQHQISDIDKFLNEVAKSNSEVILGSRFKENKISSGLPFWRKFLLKCGTYYFKTFYSLNLTDTHNGFRLIQRGALSIFSISDYGMSHATEILENVSKSGFRYSEIGVDIKYSAYSIQKGQSSLDIIEHFFRRIIR